MHLNGSKNSKSLSTASISVNGDEDESMRLLTVQEVAELLHVPASWVYGRTRQRSLERIPAYRFGKYWRFRRDEVLAWVAAHGQDSNAA